MRVSSKQAPIEQKSPKPEDNSFCEFCVCVCTHECEGVGHTGVCTHGRQRLNGVSLSNIPLPCLSEIGSLTKRQNHLAGQASPWDDPPAPTCPVLELQAHVPQSDFL